MVSYDVINQEYEVFFKDEDTKATCHNSVMRGWVKCDGAGCKKGIKTKTGVGPWPGNKPFKCRSCTKEEKTNGRNQVATMPPKSRKVAEAGLPSPSDLSPDSKPQGKGKKELKHSRPTDIKSSSSGAYHGRIICTPWRRNK